MVIIIKRNLNLAPISKDMTCGEMDKTQFRLSTHLLLLSILFAFINANGTLVGTQVPCSNEGEPIDISEVIDFNIQRCFSCICRNGFVQCHNGCPKIDDCHMVVSDACCQKKCKGCVYKNTTYASHTEWTDPTEPCKMMRCEAGIVTISDILCNVPCDNPLPPEPGKCCPTCPECKINGQIAGEDRDVISDDPCVKCRCSKGRMTCSKKACPVLQCGAEYQIHPAGECCPRCQGSRSLRLPPRTCILQSYFPREGSGPIVFDKCTNCSCTNGTSICVRETCPILDCGPDQQKPVPGACCKQCVLDTDYMSSTCSYGGKIYEEGQSWRMDSCKSCKCHSQGKVSCAMTKCNITQACAPGSRRVQIPDECCPRCQEIEGVCMVFGDPHYKTFDGKVYSFKGVGRYQLVADCANSSFSIRVANVRTNKKYSSSTQRVGVKLGDIRINLQQRNRVKLNGERVKLPRKIDGKVKIELTEDNYVEVTLHNGVKLLWSGKSFLEVTVPALYKNQLCGLCGNFNNNAQDDLKTRYGKIVKDSEVNSFGRSWCIGRKSECEEKIKSKACTKRGHNKVQNHCRSLSSGVFGECNAKLNNDKYYRACKMDMCACPSGKCYCDSILAYARECERLGGKILSNWKKYANCHSRQMQVGKSRSTPMQRMKYYNYLTKNVTQSRVKSRKPIPLMED